MKRKVINILLLLSLIFNLAVFSMFAIHFYRMRQEFGQMHCEYQPEMRERFRKIQPKHREYLKARSDLFDYLRSEDFNVNTAYKKLDLIIRRQMIMERELGKELINLRKEMSLEDFIKITEKNRFHPNYEKIRRKTVSVDSKTE